MSWSMRSFLLFVAFLAAVPAWGQDKPKPSQDEIRQLVDKLGADDLTERESASRKLEKIGKEKGKSPSQIALAWCRSQPGITSPIIGPRTMEQLNDNLGSLDIELTDDEVSGIDVVSPPGRAVSPYFQPDVINTDFGPHCYRW